MASPLHNMTMPQVYPNTAYINIDIGLNVDSNVQDPLQGFQCINFIRDEIVGRPTGYLNRP